MMTNDDYLEKTIDYSGKFVDMRGFKHAIEGHSIVSEYYSAFVDLVGDPDVVIPSKTESTAKLFFKDGQGEWPSKYAVGIIGYNDDSDGYFKTGYFRTRDLTTSEKEAALYVKEGYTI